MEWNSRAFADNEDSYSSFAMTSASCFKVKLKKFSLSIDSSPYGDYVNVRYL